VKFTWFGDCLSKNGFHSNEKGFHSVFPASSVKISRENVCPPTRRWTHSDNGRDGETINRGQTPTKTVIVAMRNDGMNNLFRDQCPGLHFEESRVANHFNRTRNANRSEVNPLSAEVSAICIPETRHVKFHLSRARKINSQVCPRSLDRGQPARFSRGDMIAASPVDLLGVQTFLSPPLTKSLIWCFFRRHKDMKAVGSDARVIVETVHAIAEVDENKCREKQTASGSGVLGPGLRGE
jgi:hypothetical protein